MSFLLSKERIYIPWELICEKSSIVSDSGQMSIYLTKLKYSAVGAEGGNISYVDETFTK